jgi:thiol-disulfide isomerase/thioredoxin
MRTTLRRISLGLLLAASQAAGAVSVGEFAPNFQLPAARDAQTGALTVRLADLRGKVVYLDFWASWCGPCKQSFPWMNELQSHYGSKGLQIVAVDVDTHSDDARAFLAALPPQFRVAFDSQGVTPRQYAIRGMPTSVLIGPDGKVLLVHNGFRPDDKTEVEAGIEQALSHSSN